ncbi:hypothetical protein NPX13_g6389 [Xylaria arbuscula]|uniref:Uncharacterized protein n=1 Tax=Xylaria arbuscula TaxID=114810 RepID=A0A9W8TM70_9PEZI|nr:hypothetical protein NPX13_g6389 [Xylaria arbuscula]
MSFLRILFCLPVPSTKKSTTSGEKGSASARRVDAPVGEFDRAEFERARENAKKRDEEYWEKKREKARRRQRC